LIRGKSLSVLHPLGMRLGMVFGRMAFSQTGIEQLGRVRFTRSRGLLSSPLGNQTDQGHSGNDQSEPDIEDRKPAQVLEPRAHKKIPVDPIAPVEGEQIIDEEGQLQLSEKKRACAQQQEQHHLCYRYGYFGHGKDFHWSPPEKTFRFNQVLLLSYNYP